MKYCKILLLFIGTSVFGHAIKKLEINGNTEADVYEIKEDDGTNTVAFVNPKAKEPTLREITYYHVIERPYKQFEGRVRYDEEEGPDFDDTMRPFTNSHGFPFMETFEKDLDDRNNNGLKDTASEEKAETLLKEIPNEDQEEIEYEIVYEEAFPEDDNTAMKVEDPAPVISEKTEPETVEINTTANPETKTEPHILVEAMTNSEIVTEDPITTSDEPVLENKAKTTRKLLFDRVKEKYYSKPNASQNSSSTLQRRKREINMHIPEAPTLGQLNYDTLPPYLRRLISTEKPKTRLNSDSESAEEEKLDDIKHRIHKMLYNLKTKEHDTDQTTDKPRARTYGMNLTADSGYVWNDLAEPKIRFTVEGSESTEEIIEDLFSEHGIHKNENESTEKIKSNLEENLKEKHQNQKPAVPSVDLDSTETPEDKGRKRHKHEEKDEDLTSQLMENEQFWMWLADWTSVYMDVLTEHLTDAIYEEVSNQINKIFEEHKFIEPEQIPDPIEDNSVEKKTDDKTTENKANEPSKDDNVPENKNIDIENENEAHLDDNNEENLLKRHKTKEEHKKKDELISKDEDAQKNKTKDNPTQMANVEAQNVYGNTLGGEVTNIFIFYQNQDQNKVLQDHKQNDTKIDVDVRINVPDSEKEIQKKDVSTNNLIEKNNEEKDSIEVTTEVMQKGNSKPTESPTDTKGTKDEINISTDAPKIEETTTIRAPVVTETNVKTAENEHPTDSTTKAPAKVTETNVSAKESEPTTESNKVESTTEQNKVKETTTDKINNSEIDKTDETENYNKEKVIETKVPESDNKQAENHSSSDGKDKTTEISENKN